MNTTELKGNWHEQKGKLKQKFATLTDDKFVPKGKKRRDDGQTAKETGQNQGRVAHITRFAVSAKNFVQTMPLAGNPGGIV